MKILEIEGVQYFRFRFSFYTADGKRHRWVRWAPAASYARESFLREVADRYRESELRAGSARLAVA